MAQAQNNSRSRQPIAFGLAILAAVLGLPAFCVFLYRNLELAAERASLRFLLWRDIAWLAAVIGLILGIVALLRLRKGKTRPSAYKLALVGVVIDGLFAIGWFLGPTRWELMRYRTPCGRNMSHLAKVMLVYASDDEYGRFPTPDKWCDLLLESGQVAEEHFIHPKRVFFLPFMTKPVLILPLPRKGRCHYALNPNAHGAGAPPDMVLLFETKEGWNQFGGRELLSTEHHRGDGCNVCLVSTVVLFEDSEGIKDLKWKVEEGK